MVNPSYAFHEKIKREEELEGDEPDDDYNAYLELERKKKLS
jgi:hypothetical protein